MNDFQAGSVLRRRADVRYRVIDDEGVVVRQAAAEVLVLNDIATRILALADGATPIDGWIEVLLAEYEVERPALVRDVLAFAAELVEQGLLEPVAGGGEAGATAASPATSAASASPATATIPEPSVARAVTTMPATPAAPANPSTPGTTPSPPPPTPPALPLDEPVVATAAGAPRVPEGSV